MAEFRNVFIFVSDALRHDYVPESVAEEGRVIPTLAPAGFTPISFSSLVTGLDPRNHGVRSFYDTLKKKTVFDLFKAHCYYDHPDDGMCKNVFANYETSKELEEMEEPFFYVERGLDTHKPYGEISHGNELPEEDTQSNENLKQNYRKGVEAAEQHFWSHVDKLKELGLYEDTLIIFTSDHGEFLGERKLFKNRTLHGSPPSKELSVVPTVFVNYNTSWNHMRTIDIAPTAASLAGKEIGADGKYLTEERPPKRGYTMMEISVRPDIVTGCNWKWKERWRPGISRIKTDLATVIKDYSGPVKGALRNNRIVHKLRDVDEVDEDKPAEHIEV